MGESPASDLCHVCTSYLKKDTNLLPFPWPCNSQKQCCGVDRISATRLRLEKSAPTPAPTPVGEKLLTPQFYAAE